MIIFNVGDGINANSLNQNFDECKNASNANETELNNIANTALLKDGSNLTPAIKNAFKQDILTEITADGAVNLADNSVNLITIISDSEVALPSILPDQYSHTIKCLVMGSEFSLDVGTSNYLLSPDINPELPYSLEYFFNKIDNNWYVYIGQ